MQAIKKFDLEKTMNILVRQYGIVKVIKAIVGSCDIAADFAFSCNDKKLENYWRQAAIAIYNCVVHIDNLPEKSKKY